MVIRCNELKSIIRNESEYFTERRRMYRMMIIVELICADWFVLSELELANIYPKLVDVSHRWSAC